MNKELYLLLQVFDKHNRGYIVASDLRAVLQCLGEDLSEEESKLGCIVSSIQLRDLRTNRKYAIEEY